MYTKVSRQINLSYIGGFMRGHERTWFSNIIYSAPPEGINELVAMKIHLAYKFEQFLGVCNTF
jgi:hypothetical protein